MLPETLLLTLTLPFLTLAARPKNAILLSEVRTLTLRGNGAKTTSRRVAAAPQLKCVSSKAVCDLFPVDVMRCTNQGSSYGKEDVEWSCTASLPEEFKLGSTDVICEGYASADDPYVLKGSCGVEYRLILTDKGEKRYPDAAGQDGRWFGGGEGDTDLGGWAFAVIFFAVLGWIIYSAWRNGSNQGQAPPGRRGHGGGGGGGGWGPGWGPGNDPPPPYPGTKPDDAQQGWRPGFWSGLAGGAAAGYLAGNRNNRQEDRHPSRGWGAGPSRSQSSSFSSNNSSSGSNSSRYESTGFGSTQRR